jgi:hypothetical protein
MALLLFVNAFGQAKKDLDIDYMLRGHIYVKSSIEDTGAPGGYGGSDNAALPTGNTFAEKGFFLTIDTSQNAVFAEEYNGYKLYIVNKSDSLVKLKASDSRLSLIAEAYYNNKWQPIEYLPSSWCGNSYHYVSLQQEEYWTATIPKFTGKLAVKLRYKLIVGVNHFVYSNEIEAHINKGQLTNKEGHNPNGLMDPYND